MSVLGTPTESIDTLPRAVTRSRAVFIASAALIYAIIIIAATLTLSPYFAQTWDVQTFIQAAHRFLDGGNPFDLYAASRAAQTWPYAYPPLHGFVTAIFLWVGKYVPILPDYVWARFPALLADVGTGIALCAVVARKSRDESLARAAMLLWLFNPVTFYNTAVQGHFESEWILFVVLAYYWFQPPAGSEPAGGSIVLPTIALAVAVLFKQVAILFAIPLWVYVFVGARNNVTLSEAKGLVASSKNKILRYAQNDKVRVITSLPLFALITIGVCLPYLLYSNDFLYMNLTYVENVPVQTQSWVVALLALTRPARDAMTSDFFLIRYSTVITMLAAIAISFFAARRGYSLWLIGALIAIAFFLTSRKVMGYYYVMLFPFLLAEFLPRRRFGIILGAIWLTSYISLSPYFAPWVNPDHIWIYAILGTINSALFVWLFVRCLVSPLTSTLSPEGRQSKISSPFQREGQGETWSRTTLFMSFGLFASAALAALMQPLAPNGGSPIRVPFIAPGAELTVLAAFAAMLALIVVGLGLLSRQLKNVPRAAWIGVLAFAPLFFVVYYLTKESTAVFEWLLQMMGV